MNLTTTLKLKRVIALIVINFNLFLFAQTPEGINYQAVILNPKGEELPGADNSRSPLVNQIICLRFKIIKPVAVVEYQETQLTTTDEFGMVNVVIGTGIRTGGTAANYNLILSNGTLTVTKIDPTLSYAGLTSGTVSTSIALAASSAFVVSQSALTGPTKVLPAAPALKPSTRALLVTFPARPAIRPIFLPEPINLSIDAPPALPAAKLSVPANEVIFPPAALSEAASTGESILITALPFLVIFPIPCERLFEEIGITM